MRLVDALPFFPRIGKFIKITFPAQKIPGTLETLYRKYEAASPGESTKSTYGSYPDYPGLDSSI